MSCVSLVGGKYFELEDIFKCSDPRRAGVGWGPARGRGADKRELQVVMGGQRLS